MKKLGILMLAMLLVCGMSVGVMAENFNKDDVEINLDVNPFMTVNFEGDSYTAELPMPTDLDEGFQHYDHSVDIPIEIKSNTQFRLTVQENISRNIANYVQDKYDNVGDHFVWAFDNSSDSRFYIVSPGVEIWRQDNGVPVGGLGTRDSWTDGRRNIHYFDSDVRNWKGFVRFDVQWRSENNAYGDNKYDFSMLEADTYTGTINATVEAQ